MCPPSPPHIQYVLFDHRFTHTHTHTPVIFILHTCISIIIDITIMCIGQRTLHVLVIVVTFFSQVHYIPTTQIHFWKSIRLVISLSYSQTTGPFDLIPQWCVFRDIVCGHVIYQSLGTCSFLYGLEIMNMW